MTRTQIDEYDPETDDGQTSVQKPKASTKAKKERTPRGRRLPVVLREFSEMVKASVERIEELAKTEAEKLEKKGNEVEAAVRNFVAMEAADHKRVRGIVGSATRGGSGPAVREFVNSPEGADAKEFMREKGWTVAKVPQKGNG